MMGALQTTDALPKTNQGSQARTTNASARAVAPYDPTVSFQKYGKGRVNLTEDKAPSAQYHFLASREKEQII